MVLPDPTFLCALAVKAGKEILKFYPPRPEDVAKKADESPVTLADQAADHIIRMALLKEYPAIGCVTEEETQSHQVQTGAFFLVDPLDGTKEFIHGRGEFTVNIALIDGGAPILGVIYVPAQDRLYYTKSPQEAFVKVGSEAERPIRIQGLSLYEPLRAVASRSHLDEKTESFLKNYAVQEQKSAGSSLKFALLAEAQADIYPRFGPTMEWDIAAGDAILRAAGGRVIDWDTQAPMCYGKPEFRNGAFVAYGTIKDEKN